MARRIHGEHNRLFFFVAVFRISQNSISVHVSRLHEYNAAYKIRIQNDCLRICTNERKTMPYHALI